MRLLAPPSAARRIMKDGTMTEVLKKACLTAGLLLAVAIAPAPASAQFAPLGQAGGDMMTQMAPMLQMMKAKMGKRRFAMMMQTMGPMMSRMMDGGGFAGDGVGDFDGGFAGMGAGGSDVTAVLGGNGGEMMSMIPQIMQMAGAGGFGGGYGRRHRRCHP